MRKNLNRPIKLLLAMVILATATFFIAFPKIGLAESQNIFVEDYAGILSKEDQEVIRQINESSFKNLDGSPQYAVVTLKELGRNNSIEEYAAAKFKQLGIGNKQLDNGFLFVISVKDRKYRLETGYGVEDVITDSMKNEIVTDEATDLLKNEEYGKAVMLISHNVEKLVVSKYGDVEAAKEYIAKEKMREAKVIRIILFSFLSVVALVGLFILVYQMKLAKLRKKLDENYISKALSGYVYGNESISMFNLKGNKKMEQVIFTNYLAKTLNKLPNKSQLLLNDRQMKLWVGQYLLADSVIQYWRNSKYPYDVSIYLEKKYFNQLKSELLGECQYFDYPVNNNPYFADELISEIGDYVETTRKVHKENLKISKENKAVIEMLCEKYLATNNIHLKKIDYELELALMVYYFLKEKDLSDPKLLQDIKVDEEALRKAYRFAEKRRKQIASDQRRKALDDLTNMSLGNYYMQAMIWSSYHNSGSSSGGGGSSFGGGASGGGGFSGGW